MSPLVALVISILSFAAALVSLWWSRQNYLNTRRDIGKITGAGVRYTFRDELKDVFIEPVSDALKRIRGGFRD